MKKSLITEQSFIFTKEEARAALAALDYVSHRQKQHNKAHIISSDFLETFRAELRGLLGL